MQTIKTIAAALSAIGVGVLTGCSTHGYLDTAKQVRDEAKIAQAASTAQEAPAAVVVTNPNAYVARKPILIKDDADALPGIFRMPRTVVFGPRPTMQDVANVLSKSTGLRFSFAPDAMTSGPAPTLPNRTRFESSLKDILDEVSAQNNLSWRYDEGGVEFFRYETRVFQVNVSPFTSSVKSSVSNKSAAGASSGSVSGSTTSANSGQDVQTQANINFWPDIQNQIKQVLTPTGRYSVGESAGTITVTDTPAALARVASVVRDINALRSQLIAVDLEVLLVRTSNEDDYGIKWDVVWNYASKGIDLSWTSPSFTGGAGGGTVGIFGGGKTGSAFDGSKALLAALSTQGNVSTVAQERRLLRNNAPSVVASLREIGYLAEVSTNAVINSGTTSSLKPGLATEGTTSTMLATVVGSSIAINSLLDITKIEKIESASSGGSSIQIPQRSVYALPIDVTLKSGQTAVYAYDTTTADATSSGVGSATNPIAAIPGGERSSKRARQTIVLLITPTLVRN